LEENKFVANLAKKQDGWTQWMQSHAQYLWIGAKRTGSRPLDFEWENGNPFLYSNWDIYQPTRAVGWDNVFMALSSGYWSAWYDENDNRTIFVCENKLIHH
jgi:hypothetical protein